jgi:hypothetical protein
MLSRTIALAAASLILVTAVSAFIATDITYEDGPLRARMSGTWYTVEINATVVDDAGRLIANALVGIRDNASGPWTTNSEGYVLIPGLADNATSYSIWANKSGYLNSYDHDVSVLPNQTATATLVIYGGTIYGIVSSPSGQLHDATVSLPSPLGYVVNVSSTDGTYTMEGVPSGSYAATATAPLFDPVSRNITVLAGKNARLDFEIYSQTGWISGYVLNSANGLGLNETNVSVTVGSGTITVTNNPDGSYRIDDLPEGTYSVTAEKNGFYASTMTGVMVVRGNGTENQNLTLVEKPTLIYGTVKSGALLQPNANVSVVGTTLYNISDVDGGYRIENLTAGTYTISAQLEGYSLVLITNVVLPVGGEVMVDIELVPLPGAVVRGVVLTKDTSEALLYVRVTLMGPDGKERTKDTNSQGQFEFTGLESEGNYTLQFQAKGYRPLEVTIIGVKADTIWNETVYLVPERTGFEGFIFGFDLAHSMMILALFITIMILAVAVYLRIRTFQAPESAPAVYDQAEEEAEEEEKESESGSGPSDEIEEKKVRRMKGGGD